MTRRAQSERMTVVVIGNGMASHALCHALVESGATHRIALSVVGEENIVAYNRVRLSDVMQSGSPDGLTLAPLSWYEQHGIDVRLGDPVMEIDREAQVVTTRSGFTQRYDYLVFATGSSAWRPPIDGIQEARCHVYRTVEDVAAIDAATTDARDAVVVGGGLLGLEAAKVLLDRGLMVSLVEAGKSLMHRQLDAETAAVLQEQIERLGVTVHAGAAIEAIQHNTRDCHVALKNGVQLRADLVVVAAGVRPRDELAKSAGLECNVRGGIVVDARLTTSDPHILAIGECASIRGNTFGLYAPCREMASVVASNLGGSDRQLGPLDVSCHLKLLGVDVVALGDYGTERRAVVFSADSVRRTLLLNDNVLVGALSVGAWPELMRVERAIHQHKTLSDRNIRRFETTGMVWGRENALPMVEWNDAAIVCNCARVTAGQIRAEAKAGAADVSLIAARTRATTVCGSCKPLVGALIGDASSIVSDTRTWGMLGLSIAALFAALVTCVMPPLAYADSVSEAWLTIDRWWRDPYLKQVSGFVLAGLAAVALVISLRKRSTWLTFGSFPLYRALHAVVGIGTLVTLLAHTGFRLGDNLNLLLMVVFLALNVIGALTGLVSGLEARVDLPLAVAARRWRRPLALAHLVSLWPLPILLGWHVLSVYYF